MGRSQPQRIPSPRREIPWINIIDRFLRRHGLTQILMDTSIFEDHPTVVALSDYGGDANRCQYYTYAFLYTGWRSLETWHRGILNLKRERFGDSRTMRYKDLGDRLRQQALPDWLLLADGLPGHLVVIAVDKGIRHLFKLEGKRLSEGLESEGLPGYSEDVAEKTLRVLHMLCYFAHFMVEPQSKFFWRTDEDEIAGSGGESVRQKRLGELFRRVLNLYIAHSLARVGYAAEFEDDELRIFEDGLSLPDLAAGALADLFTPGAEEYVAVKNREEILLWLARKKGSLNKFLFRLDFEDYNDSGEPLFTVKFLELNRANA